MTNIVFRFAGGGSAIQTNPHKYDQQKKITTMAYHKKYLPKHCQATLSVRVFPYVLSETMLDVDHGYINPISLN